MRLRGRTLISLIAFASLFALPVRADEVKISDFALSTKTKGVQDPSKGPSGLVLSTHPQPPGAQVETIDQGDLTGTVCDCGEIRAAAGPGGIGGYPKPALFALAAIAAPIFRNGGSPTPTPPVPPPTPTPEPVTLFTFGAGLMALGVVLRRRRKPLPLPEHPGN
jgi:hypothetical protein